jgi:hypothetical protein
VERNAGEMVAAAATVAAVLINSRRGNCGEECWVFIFGREVNAAAAQVKAVSCRAAKGCIIKQ